MTAYKTYAIEATKITLLCLLITGLYKLLSVSNKNILVIFNIAVMSCASTFTTEKKEFSNIILGVLVIIASTVFGGVLGFYAPLFSEIVTVVYAGLAFYLPKSKEKLAIFVSGAVVFMIFSALPFSVKDGLRYLLDGLGVLIIFIIFYFIFDHKKSSQIKINSVVNDDKHITAFTAVISLIIAYGLTHLLYHEYHLPHLYWIGLTVLMVIQGSHEKTIHTSLKRIAVNSAGALISVILFSYILPQNFWINFFMLVLFLFLIFCLSFSYVARVFFIELLVLGFAYMLGTFHTFIAFDRFLLTLLGGIIVIGVTLIFRLIKF